MLRHIGKWTAVDAKDAGIGETGVAGEVHHGEGARLLPGAVATTAYLLLLCRLSFEPDEAGFVPLSLNPQSTGSSGNGDAQPVRFHLRTVAGF